MNYIIFGMDFGGIIISKKLFYWHCSDCRAKNSINADELGNFASNEDIMLICGRCGLAHELLQTLEDTDWIDCIPLEGLEKIIPVGFTFDPGTQDKKWNDGKGNSLLRTDFIKQYGLDPEINWNFRRNKIRINPAILNSSSESPK
jgi:hypothetical protein